MLRHGMQAFRRAAHRFKDVGASRRFASDKPAPPSQGQGVVTSRLNALTVESESSTRLFEGARPPPEAAPKASHAAGLPGAGPAAATAAAEAGPGAAHSAGARLAAGAGNAFFLGLLGAGAYAGYLQWRYTREEVAAMAEEMRREDSTREAGEGPSGTGSLVLPLVDWYVGWRTYLEGELRKYADPPSDALLPDLPPAARHVKTLVLDLDGVLVHSDWTRERGWRTFKRPGVEDFLGTMAQYYELVIYTSQLPTYADPILDRLDPQRLVQYRLYRDSTQYVGGRHVRDLSKLNRDPRQVLLLTSDAHAYALQPDSAIKLQPWKLEAQDTTLLDLIPFLEAIVRTAVPDVRDVVKSYEGLDVAAAFKERMAKVQEQQQQRKHTSKGFFGSFRS